MRLWTAARAAMSSALLGLLLACGAGPGAASPSTAARVPPVAWQTSLDRDHPLVGRIWDVRHARFVDERELRASLRGYVLLGEKHDNPDHHALEARLVLAMRAEGRRPVVAFEMLDRDEQARIDAARAASPQDPDAIARAVDWDHSGWPAFSMYRPVVAAALATGLPLVATGLSDEEMHELVHGGDTDVPEPAPLDAEAEASLREELVDAHCGKLPASMLGGMARVQRGRDATMALAMADALETTGATDVVLVAGSGHARRDRGAPRDLAWHAVPAPVVSVAFVEVEAGLTAPPAYAERWNAPALPFDFAWFTPRANDDDPCAEFEH